MTALALVMAGTGTLLIWAGIADANIAAELQAALTGKAPPPRGPKSGESWVNPGAGVPPTAGGGAGGGGGGSWG